MDTPLYDQVQVIEKKECRHCYQEIDETGGPLSILPIRSIHQVKTLRPSNLAPSNGRSRRSSWVRDSQRQST